MISPPLSLPRLRQPRRAQLNQRIDAVNARVRAALDARPKGPALAQPRQRDAPQQAGAVPLVEVLVGDVLQLLRPGARLISCDLVRSRAISCALVQSQPRPLARLISPNLAESR